MTPTSAGYSAGAARSFSPQEIEELRATASALPADWCLTLEGPYNQLAVKPRHGAYYEAYKIVVIPDGRFGDAGTRRRR